MTKMSSIARADRRTSALYARHRTEIYAFCRRRLRQHEAAEDATQIVFVKALRALRNGTTPRDDGAWLFAIARNVVATKADKRARLRAVEIGDVDVDPPERTPVEADDVRALLCAVESLPETPRRALLLREWRGLEYQEIASELGLERNAVGVMLLRARHRVAAAIVPAIAHTG